MYSCEIPLLCDPVATNQCSLFLHWPLEICEDVSRQIYHQLQGWPKGMRHRSIPTRIGECGDCLTWKFLFASPKSMSWKLSIKVSVAAARYLSVNIDVVWKPSWFLFTGAAGTTNDEICILQEGNMPFFFFLNLFVCRPISEHIFSVMINKWNFRLKISSKKSARTNN